MRLSVVRARLISPLVASTFLFVGVWPSKLHAAIIISSCVTAATDVAQGSAPSQPLPVPVNPEFTRSFSYFAEAVRNVQSGIPALRNRGLSNDQELSAYRDLGQSIDDLRVYFHSALNTVPDGESCQSTAQAIVPFMASFRPGSSVEDLRVGYRICSYFHDQQRQMLIEGTCRVIGSARGYSLRQIDERFTQIDRTVARFRDVLQGATLLSGVVASLRLFRGFGRLRVFMAGSGTSIAIRVAIVAAPTLAAGAVIRYTDILDLPIRNTLDLRDSAKLVYNGRLEDVVRVTQPIEAFEGVLADYLNSISEPPP